MEGVVATRERSGLAVSADGEVCVNREVTMTAMARDEEGHMFVRISRERTQQVVGQVSGIFAISGSEVEESAPRRHHSSTMYDDDDDDKSSMTEAESAPRHHHFLSMYDDDDDDDGRTVKVCVCIFSLIFGSLPVATIVVGILDYSLCPGYTRVAIYMIVQGATSVFIPILVPCWWFFQGIRGKIIGAICVIIALFNIGWGIMGSLWLASSPCKDTLLFTHALGFSVPMWIFFCLVPLVFVVCVRTCCKYRWWDWHSSNRG